MSRLIASLLACFALSLVPACGGGGGGGGPSDPGAPGTLRAVAIEGEVAPATGGGTYAAFPAFPIMDAARNAWSAFVATITGGTTTSVVYVALPDGTPTLVRALAEGDAVAGTDRAILDFAGVWMCEDGTVIALANLTGGVDTQDFALLAVDIVGGLATNLRVVLLDEASLAPAIAGGVLSDIDPMTLLKEDDATLWFLATDSVGGDTHLVSMELDGTDLRRRVSPGDAAVGGGDPVLSVDAFSVDPTGTYYGWVVTDAGGVRRVSLRETIAGPSVNVQVLQDSNPLPSGVGTVADAWKRGRILVYGDASMTWVAKGTQSGADDIFMLYQHNAVVQHREMARTTETAPSTGMGTWSRIDALNAAPAAQRVMFDGGVSGGTFGVTEGTYQVTGVNPPNVIADTANLVASGGAVVPAPYISLRQTTRPYDEVAFNGDLGYAQMFSGTSVLWWLVRAAGNNIFGVAAQGGTAPGGDTFTSFSGGAALTIAPGIFLFRAGLTTAGTGIFRQGP